VKFLCKSLEFLCEVAMTAGVKRVKMWIKFQSCKSALSSFTKLKIYNVFAYVHLSSIVPSADFRIVC